MTVRREREIWMTSRRGMSDQFQRRHLNTDQKRTLKEADVSRFLRQYKRKAQKGSDPNDRSCDDEARKLVERMSPENLDLLINDEF
jgi:hypothetical protein